MSKWKSPQDRHTQLTGWTPTVSAQAKEARANGTFDAWSSERADKRTYEDAIYCGELYATAPVWEDLTPEQKASVHKQRLSYAATMQKFAKTLCN